MSPLVLAALLTVSQAEAAVEISPNPTCYRPVTLTFTGPEASETDTVNPFRDFRCEVEFAHEDAPFGDSAFSKRVPGFFAADGNAAESGADAGDRWRARLLPIYPGRWRYRIRSHAGVDAALPATLEETLGHGKSGTVPIAPDGVEGSFHVAEPDSHASGFYGTGPVRITSGLPPNMYDSDGDGKPDAFGSFNLFSPRSIPMGPRRLRHVGSGRIFLKAGADSPENLLAYADFDGTKPTHRYEPHVRDWNEGDPTWRGGKGKGLIGALNYLASQGINSVYFLPMNVGGDGKDVWPWVDENARDRFDVSKLDQWGIAFDHAARLGIALHVVLTETENESLFEALDGGRRLEDLPAFYRRLGFVPRWLDFRTTEALAKGVPFAETRAIYYRELIARFAHHPAIVWNLGEENGGGKPDPLGAANTTEQRKAYSAYIQSLDPHGHPIVVHTHPGEYEKVYEPLLRSEPVFGPKYIDGLSLQMGDPRKAHAETLKWLRKSKEARGLLFVCVDEIGPADTGVVPDDAPNAAENHRLARSVLWGNLLAGGSGVEWYFGYKHPHNDLNLEDFRSRADVWKFTKAAVDFMHEHLPFERMEPADELVRAEGAFCLAEPGEVYAVYLPNAERPVEMKLPEGEYEVRWFDPAEGGPLRTGTADVTSGGDRAFLGEPSHPKRDWVVLVRRVKS